MKECTTEWCQEKTGLDPALVEEACLAWATRPEGQTYGNGGIHLNLAPDQVGNCAQTVRAVLHLSYMTGNFDGPAGNRGLTRTPVDEQATAAPGVNMPQEVKWTLKGMEAITGEPQCPPFYLPDVKLEPTNIPDRREILSNMVGAEKFPILPYYNEWADATCIWEACINGDPYPLKGGINESGSFMNMSNATLAWEALSKLDFWVDINMFHHPGTEMADIILPCQHWTELNNIRVSQGASGGIGLTQRAIEPPADTKFDYDINRLIFEALEKQGNPNGTWMSIKGDGPGAYHHDDRLEEWFQAHNEKSGFDTRYPGCKWEHFEDFKEDFQENGWINAKEIEPDRWGTYRRFETGWMRMGKDACTAAPWSVDDSGQPVNNFGCPTPNALVEFWSMAFETYCIDMANEFEPGKFDPIKEMMPNYEPPASSADGGKIDLEEYPIILTTGRRIPVYFHSEHRQLPWCRELWPSPRLEMNPNDAARLGLEQGQWIWIRSPWGAIREVVDLYYGIKEGTVNANHAWWYPEIDTASHGFELVNINCTMDKYAQCWICGASQLRGVPVLVYPATPENSPHGNPVPCDPQGNPVITNANDPRLKEWLANDPRLEDSKVELTFANMAAVGCQPSVQSPDLLSGGKLAVGSVGGDALGAYSKSK